MINKRKLGGTDIYVSPIGLGTVKFGRTEQVKYPEAFSLPTDKEINNLLSLAKDLGINLLDTAPAYGSSERRIGDILGNNRSEWILSSKVGEDFIDGKSIFNFTPEHIEASVYRSLKLLRTDYIDIMLIHSDGNDLDIINGGAIDCLNHLKNKGVIRATGMSTKTIPGGLEVIKKSDVAMVTYNITDTESIEIIDEAAKLNKGIFIKKGLMSGHLKSINHPHPIKVAAEFILKNKGVSSMIVGTINENHLRENVLAAGSESINT